MKRNEKNEITLSVNHLSKKYDKIEAVRDVSFDATCGEIIALLGPNGAGKSTLMNIIAGYLKPTSGQVYVNGNDVEKNDLLTKKDIGFLPEGAPMYGDMSVKLFLEYFIELKLGLMVSEDFSRRKIEEVYKQELNRIVDVAKIRDVLCQKIETLSKGYTRRVGFAASLIGNPPILLLDEPTDGLDPNQKKHMCELIKDMSKDKTILISTHLLDEAESIVSKIILINKGKIVISGTVKDIISATKTKALEQAFMKLTLEGTDDE